MEDLENLGWKPTYVSMREYLGASELEQSFLVQDIPALYYWVLDFARPRSREDWEEFLQRTKGPFGPSKPKPGDVPYLDLTTRVKHEGLNSEKLKRLIALLSTPSAISSWARASLTAIQRPLYIGITKHLAVRFKEHRRESGQGFASKLNDDFDFDDCALIYVELPEELIGMMFDDKSNENDNDEPDRGLLPDALRDVEDLTIRLAMPPYNDRI